MSGREGVQATGFVFIADGKVVAHAEASGQAMDSWKFVIPAHAMDGGGIDPSCKTQYLEGASDVQAREALDRLGHAVTAACAAARERRETTTAAVRKAVVEPATPPLFDK